MSTVDKWKTDKIILWTQFVQVVFANVSHTCCLMNVPEDVCHNVFIKCWMKWTWASLTTIRLAWHLLKHSLYEVIRRMVTKILSYRISQQRCAQHHPHHHHCRCHRYYHSILFSAFFVFASQKVSKKCRLSRLIYPDIENKISICFHGYAIIFSHGQTPKAVMRLIYMI